MARAGLTPTVVVEEAARLVDKVGPDRLTLAALAEGFGVAVPSLYKHVGGLDDLKRRVAARSLGELGDALAGAAVGKAGGDALGAVAAAYRAYARSHPGRYATTLAAPGPHADADADADADAGEHEAAAAGVLATVLAVLAGYGLDGADAIDAARVVRSALHGFVALEAGGGFGMPHDVDRSFGRLVAALDAALAGWAPA